MAVTQNNAALAVPYKKQIGRVTFQVSSFANMKSTQTAGQMLFGLMESRIVNQDNKISQEVKKK